MRKVTTINFFSLFAFLSILGLSACETTTKEKKPLKCINTREYVTERQQQAESGDVKEQQRVAAWYEHGDCLPKNLHKAIYWYQRAAEGGDNWSFRKIAALYRYQINDIESALVWYTKGAEAGDVTASRILGDIYFQGKAIPKDLDEAEKWYRLAVEQGDYYSRNTLSHVIREKDPVTWASKQYELQETKTKELAKDAKARFGSISVSILEIEESKRIRAEVRDKLNSLPEYTNKHGEIPGDEMLGGMMMSILYAGPFGPPLVLMEAIRQETGQAKPKKQYSREEKAEIKNAISSLGRILAEEDVERNFQIQLLALAERQQADHLLTSSSAPYVLHINIQQIGLFRVPGDLGGGRLWLAVNARLVDSKQEVKSIEQRVCYGSRHASPLVSWSENNSQKLKEELNQGYRYVSNQILSEMVGLAPDPDTIYTWDKTALACVEDRKEGESDKPGKN